MATVTVVNAERTLEIEATSIVEASVNTSGHLILVRHDGTEIDAGAVSGMQLDSGASYSKVDAFTYVGDTDPGAVPDGSVWLDTSDVAGPIATDTQKGLVELATGAEATAGTDTSRAVTPAALATAVGGRLTALETIQVHILASNSALESATPASYAVGISIMTATTSSGWTNNAGFGTVVTFKSDVDRVVQKFHVNASSSTITPRTWTRHGVTGGGGWTAWVQEQSLYTLVPANFGQSTALSGYPLGWSRLIYTTANSTAWDFTGKAGEVLTFVDGTDFAKQTFTRHVGGSSAATEIWTRTYNNASGWSAWQKSVFEDRVSKLPTAMASGRESVTPSAANTPTAKTVTFPAGRFTTAPNVVVAAETTVPGTQVTGVGFDNVTTTGFTIYVTRTNTTATIVQWTATQF